MAGNACHGIFVIPSTPFRDDLRVDEDGLAQVVEFCCRCGAHGLVWPVMASEFQTLSDSERIRGYRLVVAAAAGRVPVVAGVAGTCIPHAVELAQAAADALIAMPPYTVKLEPESVFAYFRALAEVGSRPIFVQNAAPPLGSPVGPAFLARMAREIPRVEYLKEEAPPALRRISEVVAIGEPAIQGIFGGGGGNLLVEELRRRASGNMPSPAWADVLVEVYERYRADNEAGARAIHRRLRPAIELLRQTDTRMAKEVLVRRGIIRSAITRVPSRPLDAEDRHELDLAMEELADLLRV